MHRVTLLLNHMLSDGLRQTKPVGKKLRILFDIGDIWDNDNNADNTDNDNNDDKNDNNYDKDKDDENYGNVVGSTD